MSMTIEALKNLTDQINAERSKVLDQDLAAVEEFYKIFFDKYPNAVLEYKYDPHPFREGVILNINSEGLNQETLDFISDGLMILSQSLRALRSSHRIKSWHFKSNKNQFDEYLKSRQKEVSNGQNT